MARTVNVEKGLRAHPKTPKQAKQVYENILAEEESAEPAEDDLRSTREETQASSSNTAHERTDHSQTASGTGTLPISTTPSSNTPTPTIDRPLTTTPLSTTPSIPRIANFTCTVNLTCQIDLKTLAMNVRNTEYNPKRFAAVIVRIRDPRITALVFHNGKMVITGCRSENESKLGARKCAKIVQKCGFSPQFIDFKIRNVVAVCDARFIVDLEALAERHARFTSYEPEIFPALMYRFLEPKVVLMIFVSGKVVITGAKRREEVYEVWEIMFKVLAMFRGSEMGKRLRRRFDE